MKDEGNLFLGGFYVQAKVMIFGRTADIAFLEYLKYLQFEEKKSKITPCVRWYPFVLIVKFSDPKVLIPVFVKLVILCQFPEYSQVYLCRLIVKTFIERMSSRVSC
jgi:hypothetical protein